MILGEDNRNVHTSVPLKMLKGRSKYLISYKKKTVWEMEEADTDRRDYSQRSQLNNSYS